MLKSMVIYSLDCTTCIIDRMWLWVPLSVRWTMRKSAMWTLLHSYVTNVSLLYDNGELLNGSLQGKEELGQKGRVHGIKEMLDISTM